MAQIAQRVAEIETKLALLDPPFNPNRASSGATFAEAVRVALGEGGLRESSSGRARRRLTPADVEPLVQAASLKYGLPPELIHAVIEAESDYNPHCVSRAGAMGLMQLMPATIKAFGISDPFDPAQNIDGGCRELKGYLERFKRLDLALAAYNAGPAAVRKYGGIPPYRETQTYVRRVISILKRQGFRFDLYPWAFRAVSGPRTSANIPNADRLSSPNKTTAALRPLSGQHNVDANSRSANNVPGQVAEQSPGADMALQRPTQSRHRHLQKEILVPATARVEVRAFLQRAGIVPHTTNANSVSAHSQQTNQAALNTHPGEQLLSSPEFHANAGSPTSSETTSSQASSTTAGRAHLVDNAPEAAGRPPMPIGGNDRSPQEIVLDAKPKIEIAPPQEKNSPTQALNTSQLSSPSSTKQSAGATAETANALILGRLKQYVNVPRHGEQSFTYGKQPAPTNGGRPQDNRTNFDAPHSSTVAMHPSDLMSAGKNDIGNSVSPNSLSTQASASEQPTDKSQISRHPISSATRGSYSPDDFDEIGKGEKATSIDTAHSAHFRPAAHVGSTLSHATKGITESNASSLQHNNPDKPSIDVVHHLLLRVEDGDGSLSLFATHHSGAVYAHVTVQHPEQQEALQQAFPSLRANLSQEQIDLSALSVSLSGHGTTGGQTHSHPEPTPLINSVHAGDTEAPSAEQPQRVPPAMHRGLLHIYA